ncbi:putative UDP-glucose lipid carrier transferase [Rhabdaerophilaceae bacterium]
MSIEIMANVPRNAQPVSRWPRIFSTLSKTKVIAGVLFFDLAVLWVSGAVALLMQDLPLETERWVSYLSIAIIPILAVYILQRLWAYTIPALAGFARQARALLASLTGSFVIVMGLYFIANINVMSARVWLIHWFLASVVLLIIGRVFVGQVVMAAQKRGELARRAVIVGGGKACEDLITRLEHAGESAIKILGIFDDRGEERSPELVGRYRKIGTFEELEQYSRDNNVDLLIIALPPTAEDRILHLLKKLWELPLDVRIAAHSAKLKLSKRAYTYIGDVPFLAVFDRPLSDWNAMVKACFDRMVAMLALLLLAPLLAIVALAVKLDSRGPIFFRQQRFGFKNNPIGVYKFRSMYVDATDAHGSKQVTKGDPRVTRVGRIIRKTSIDELPQLINVLRGELSLVGPRPHALHSKAANQLYQDVVAGYFARHRMKPGITGWAQINGWRGETDTFEKIERRVEHDLHYIENWSLALDLYILAVTPLSLLNTKNAY